MKGITALAVALGMTMASGSLDQLPENRPETHKPDVITRNHRVRGTQLRGKALLGQARCDAKVRTYVRTYEGELLGNLESLRVPVMRHPVKTT
jgi:hypothetical protein